MNCKWAGISAGVALLFLTSFSHAADVDNGKAQYGEKCTQCHGTDLFSSARAKITNIDDLRTRVNMCQLNVGAQWFDEDIDDVTAYVATLYKTLKPAADKN